MNVQYDAIHAGVPDRIGHHSSGEASVDISIDLDPWLDSTLSNQDMAKNMSAFILSKAHQHLYSSRRGITLLSYKDATLVEMGNQSRPLDVMIQFNRSRSEADEYQNHERGTGNYMSDHRK